MNSLKNTIKSIQNNKLTFISIIFGLVSLITAISHKMMIKDFEIYRSFTSMAFIPFIVFILLIISQFTFGFVINIKNKNYKSLLSTIIVTGILIGLFIVILIIDKELFIYAT